MAFFRMGDRKQSEGSALMNSCRGWGVSHVTQPLAEAPAFLGSSLPSGHAASQLCTPMQVGVGLPLQVSASPAEPHLPVGICTLGPAQHAPSSAPPALLSVRSGSSWPARCFGWPGRPCTRSARGTASGPGPRGTAGCKGPPTPSRPAWLCPGVALLPLGTHG